MQHEGGTPIGLGVHVVDVARLARAMARRGERLERRVFTPAELADCAPRRDRPNALAARWAAKGALLRALAARGAFRPTPRRIEVRREAGGRPRLRILADPAERAEGERLPVCHLTLSHEAGLAVAVVVLESRPSVPGSG